MNEIYTRVEAITRQVILFGDNDILLQEELNKNHPDIEKIQQLKRLNLLYVNGLEFIAKDGMKAKNFLIEDNNLIAVYEIFNSIEELILHYENLLEYEDNILKSTSLEDITERIIQKINFLIERRLELLECTGSEQKKYLFLSNGDYLILYDVIYHMMLNTPIK